MYAHVLLLWTLNSAIMVQVIELIVTKNEVKETELQLAKTVRAIVSRKFGKTVSFYLQYFLFWVSFTVVAKTFLATLEFINVHLQQWDQVASELRTADFWLIVCGDSCVLTVATKWAISTVLPVHIHYPPCFIFNSLCCTGMNSVQEILCWYIS